MAYIALSSITGCTNPPSGGTADYQDMMYNDEKIVAYYKKTIEPSGNNSFTRIYQVIVIFENYTQQFNFLGLGDRDAFYGILPTT